MGRLFFEFLCDGKRKLNIAVSDVSRTRSTLPGHSEKEVKRGAPVISSYEEVGLLTSFPVHDKEDLTKLDIYWSKNTLSPPIDQIRDYFGESVALYWSFARAYTRLLVIIAFLGLIEHCVEQYGVNYVYTNVTFTFLNLLSLAFFCELWKRQSNEHSFYWGTAGKLRLKPPRPEYRGDLRENPVTGKPEMFYPPIKRLKTLMLVSVPVTVICLLVAFLLMILSLEAEKWMADYLLDPDTEQLRTDLSSQILINLPSILYSLIILIFNKIYFKIGRWLTVKENHRTDDQHNLHLTLKLIAFEFVNTFIALFYVGFWQRDLPGLRAHLCTTLITQQVVNQVMEVIIPYFLQTPTTIKLQYKMAKMASKLGINEKPRARQLRVTDLEGEDNVQVIHQVYHDLLADPLDADLHDDFMEMWLQFGHVFLFAAIYPLAAAIALLNNITEFYADKYKLMRLTRKPKPLAVRDIGGWYLAFRLTAFISIATNCALIALDLHPTASSRGWSDLQWWGMFVVVEKIFEVIFIGINSLIPDTSSRVKIAMDRTDFHFKQKTVKAQ